jgi:UDP-N-acetylglucosamine 4,6-dehydratase/5-epimerase
LKVFISGITGSLGTEVTRQLLEQGVHQITGYSRCDHKQKAFPYKKDVALYLGDIRDRDRLLEATRGADIIFHFAAFKHVDSAEIQPEECIATNVAGTNNVLFCQRMNKIKRVVFTSTDKACDPINVYGCTKLIGERLVMRNPNNLVARYGNVIASNGSVIPSFVKTLKKERKVYITDTNMNRFFIRLEDAAAFVIENGLNSKGGKYIPEMRACSIEQLADAVAKVMRIKTYGMVNMGIRPGEKMFEQLVSPHEGTEIRSDKATQFTKKELIELIRPSVEALL